MEKECSKCGVVKPLDEYSKDVRAKDGRFGACKECEKIRRAKWESENAERVKAVRHQYNLNNKDEIAAYNQKHYKENHEYHIQRKRRYNKEARDKILPKKQKYYIDNREQELIRGKRWAQENPEKACQKTMRREALKRKNAVGKVDYTEILKRDGYNCHICGGEVAKDDVHFDHIIPLSKGGAHSMDNIAVSHSRCNIVKGNKVV